MIPGKLLPEAPRSSIDSTTAAQLMEQYRDRRDDTGEVIEDLGFTISLLSVSRSREWTDISMRCSSESSGGGPANNLIVSLPERGSAKARMVNVTTLKALLVAALETTDAQWGVVAHPRQMSSVHPYVGWMTFLRVSLTEIPTLPELCVVEELRERGVLLIGGEAPPDPLLLSDQRHYYDIERRLREAGLLEPIEYES